MFVDEITVKNFRCFKTATLRLGKITLLLGPNSSGKSSLLNALLSAAQSKHFPIDYSPNGEHVQLGDYDSIVYGHRKELPFSLGFKLSEMAVEQNVWLEATYRSNNLHMPSLRKAEYRSPALALTLTNRLVRWRRLARTAPPQSAFDEQLGQFMSSFYSLLQDGEKDRKGSRKASARRKQIGEQQSGSARLENVTDFRSKAFTMAPGDPELTRQFVRVGNAMSSLDQDFTYIGSFRHAPERTYYQSAQTVAKIGRFGEHYIDQLSKWEHDKAPQFRNLLKRLRELQLLSNIRINRLPGGRLDVIVKTQGRGVTASLADVGFGVSQFLPIIIADLQLGPRTTLAVSQPEIHLHPSVQAATTNYFVDQAIRHDKRYILETHSEYIVNRLRLLVVEERIKPEDISVVYLERGTSGVELRQIEFTKDGRILGAPEEYFATYLADVMDIALKA